MRCGPCADHVLFALRRPLEIGARLRPSSIGDGIMMITGLVTSWLCLALGALPADVVPMKDRNFQLPIRSIDPVRRAELRELVLYYSQDEGRSWKRYSSVPPDSRAFIVNLTDDGIYWFNVCVVDQRGT